MSEPVQQLLENGYSAAVVPMAHGPVLCIEGFGQRSELMLTKAALADLYQSTRTLLEQDATRQAYDGSYAVETFSIGLPGVMQAWMDARQKEAFGLVSIHNCGTYLSVLMWRDAIPQQQAGA